MVMCYSIRNANNGNVLVKCVCQQCYSITYVCKVWVYYHACT